jgi:hypothetical protein
MRMMLRVRVDTAKGSEAVKSGALPKVIAGLMEKTKPEAAYFTLDNGQRCAFLVFDMTESSMMPSIAEDLFTTLGAEVHLVPAMNADDLKAGLAAAM